MDRSDDKQRRVRAGIDPGWEPPPDLEHHSPCSAGVAAAVVAGLIALAAVIGAFVAGVAIGFGWALR